MQLPTSPVHTADFAAALASPHVEAALATLCSEITRVLRDEWQVPITTQEVFAIAFRWCDRHKRQHTAPPGATKVRLVMPGRPDPNRCSFVSLSYGRCNSPAGHAGEHTFNPALAGDRCGFGPGAGGDDSI